MEFRDPVTTCAEADDAVYQNFSGWGQNPRHLIRNAKFLEILVCLFPVIDFKDMDDQEIIMD